MARYSGVRGESRGIVISVKGMESSSRAMWARWAPGVLIVMREQGGEGLTWACAVGVENDFFGCGSHDYSLLP